VVEQEVSIGGGQAIDLVASRDGDRIAFEIETGKSDAGANVGKCLDAGMAKVIVVATSVAVYARLLNILPRNDRVVLQTVSEVLTNSRV
jgi:hypothetical protein